MDDGSSIFMITALIVLIMLSAFFSASETAYSSLNMIRLKSRAEDGDKQAAKVLALAERYDSLLSTILIGNNIVNIGASSLAKAWRRKCRNPLQWPLRRRLVPLWRYLGR